MTVIRFQATPNPNAVKCIVDGSFGPTPRSYFSAAEARGDAIAEAIFALAGVTNVLINGDWMTVCKEDGTPWEPIQTGVTRVLADVEGE